MADTTRFERLTLLDLPNEVLLQIFELSREPCLIHTSRRLYQVLPNYLWYTKALLCFAFNTVFEGTLPHVIIQYTIGCHPSFLRDFIPWKRSDRIQLQADIARRAWPNVTMYQKLQVMFFKVMIIKRALLGESLRDPLPYLAEHPETFKVSRSRWPGDSEPAYSMDVGDVVAGFDKHGCHFQGEDFESSRLAALWDIRHVPDCLLKGDDSDSKH